IEDETDADQPFEFDFDAVSPADDPVDSVPSADAAASQRSIFAADDDGDDSLQWMSDLEALDGPGTSPASSEELDGGDDFLAPLGDFDNMPAADQDLMVTGDDIDFNRLLSDPAFADFEIDPADIADSPQQRVPSPDSPDWLSDVSIREVSASALVRQQQDRPLENLPDRL